MTAWLVVAPRCHVSVSLVFVFTRLILIEILSWYLVYESTMTSYRSKFNCLLLVPVSWFLRKLQALNLDKFLKIKKAFLEIIFRMAWDAVFLYVCLLWWVTYHVNVSFLSMDKYPPKSWFFLSFLHNWLLYPKVYQMTKICQGHRSRHGICLVKIVSLLQWP